MDKKTILSRTESFIKEKLSGEGTGHDWWHVHRVRNIAMRIAKEEDADLFIVELAALLHDISDWKFCDGDEESGPRAARRWLEGMHVDEAMISHVCDIIRHMSFKGANVKADMSTKEGMVVQDADRLDAMGAIGIARAFAYGGHKGHEICNPDIKPQLHDSFESYKKSSGPTINHFYEKLLLLKGLMNTGSAKKIAAGRHAYMEAFLKEFHDEWEAKK